MRYYHHVSFEEVLQSGKITRDLLQKAIDDKSIPVIKEHALTGKEWISGLDLYNVFGEVAHHFSHVA